MERKNINIILEKHELDNLRSKNLPALFLDRDGVIIKDLHYLSNPAFVELENGVKDLFSNTLNNGYPIIIITNQSGIEKGYFGWKEYELVNKKMMHLLGSQKLPTAIYANSQENKIPQKCWRKPSPNMLFQARDDLNINLEKSIIIGDRLSDLEAGINAGLFFAYHVATGHGKNERENVKNFISKYANKDLENKLLKVLLIDSLKDLPKDLFGQ